MRSGNGDSLFMLILVILIVQSLFIFNLILGLFRRKTNHD